MITREVDKFQTSSNLQAETDNPFDSSTVVKAEVGAEHALARVTLRYVHACSGDIYKVSRVITAPHHNHTNALFTTDADDSMLIPYANGQQAATDFSSVIWCQQQHYVTEETRLSESDAAPMHELLSETNFTPPQLLRTLSGAQQAGDISAALMPTSPLANSAHGGDLSISSIAGTAPLGPLPVNCDAVVADTESMNALDMMSVCTDGSRAFGDGNYARMSPKVACELEEGSFAVPLLTGNTVGRADSEFDTGSGGMRVPVAEPLDVPSERTPLALLAA